MLPQGISCVRQNRFSVFCPGLPTFGPSLVSSSPFPPEEEVFAISIERERRAPILWQIDSLEEKMKEDGSVFAFQNSPPPELEDSSIVEEPATPPPLPMVNILSWKMSPLGLFSGSKPARPVNPTKSRKRVEGPACAQLQMRGCDGIRRGRFCLEKVSGGVLPSGRLDQVLSFILPVILSF